ncbi:hypothetical protein [Granulicoccus sp. GXG6511]|uniref:hypothetical protein n=1 Tax=Granulicoccus sp. GXG6511 TaxID=3381351 RepID=UPI003D7DF209
MNRDELDDLLEPRDLPDRHGMLRDVFATVSAERADGRADPRGFSDAHPDQFSASAFRRVRSTPTRRWLQFAAAAAMVVVLGGVGWMVARTNLGAEPGAVPAPTATSRPDPASGAAASPSPPRTPTPTAAPTPTTTARATNPPAVTVVGTRVGENVLFVTYRICSGTGVATLTGPFVDHDADVELPPDLPPRLGVAESLGPEECVLRAEVIPRPAGPVSGRLDVRIGFGAGTPENQYTAYYGDLYSG